jgi:hypothetical protein
MRFPTDCLLFVNCAADYLKIGDLVTFKSVEFDSYICSEGILQEDVFVSKDFSQFDNCLFAIHHCLRHCHCLRPLRYTETA